MTMHQINNKKLTLTSRISEDISSRALKLNQNIIQGCWIGGLAWIRIPEGCCVCRELLVVDIHTRKTRGRTVRAPSKVLNKLSFLGSSLPIPMFSFPIAIKSRDPHARSRTRWCSELLNNEVVLPLRRYDGDVSFDSLVRKTCSICSGIQSLRKCMLSLEHCICMAVRRPDL